MNLPSTSWSERIPRGVLAAMVLCGAVANAQSPAPPAGCGNGPGDSCITNSATYGYYRTRWRRWPDVARVLEPVPATPTVDKPAKKPPAAEQPTDTPNEKSPNSPAVRPPVDETLPEPPQQPPQVPDVDLPPKPPETMLDETLTPPVPLPPRESREVPRIESPAEPPQSQPKPPQPTEPTLPPAMPPGADLPQPSLEDDLRNLLPEEKPPAVRGKVKPKTPDIKPPAKSRLKEDPFIDDPIPGEKPPAQPRQGRRQPADSPGESELGGAGPNHLQWGADEAEEVRAAVPAALFQLEPPRATSRQPTIEITESRPTDRRISNTLRETVAQREANPSSSSRSNPLRRSAPSKSLGGDTGASDQFQQTGESASAGASIANPLR